MNTGILRPRHPASPVPGFWNALITRLGGSPRLAGELWACYTELYPVTSTTVAYALENVCREATSMAVVSQRLVHFERMLPPRALFAAALQLAPEGRPRRRDVVQFEQALLQVTRGPETWR